MPYLQQLIIICPLVFFAGLVDAIAGGGGIISLPAYYVAGVPPIMALGTNKMASSCGTTISTLGFIKNGKINKTVALYSVPTALLGAYLGAILAQRLNDDILRYILLVALPILAIFIITNKRIGAEHKSKEISNNKLIVQCLIAGLVIGGYDGFFGPGTGTFLILVFHGIIGLDLLTASGNAKIVNLSSNIASLISFLIGGKVLFALALPAAAASILGNWIGYRLALSKGAKIIRPAFVFVLILLMAKIGYDVFIG